MNTNVMFSSTTDQWATPQDFFDKLNAEFHFNLDPCADDTNHKCKQYFNAKQNGLSKDWTGCRVFCNPPYGRDIGRWVQKCATEKTEVTVMLIPARTDTSWFHDYIYGKSEIRFIRGRLKFGDSKNSAPFPSMVIVLRKDGKQDG